MEQCSLLLGTNLNLLEWSLNLVILTKEQTEPASAKTVHAPKPQKEQPSALKLLGNRK